MPPSTKQRLGVLLSAGVFATVVGTAVALAAGDQASSNAAASSTTLARERSGASHVALAVDPLPTEAQILQSIVQGLGGDRILSAQLGNPPLDLPANEDGASTSLVPGTWLYYTVAAPRLDPSVIRSMWEANLVTGVFRDEVHTNGFEPPIGSQISFQLSDGSSLRPIRGIGNVRFSQQFASGPASSIETDVARNAASAGLEVETVATLAPLQPAPILIVKTTDPSLAAATLDDELTRIFGSSCTYEGYFFEIDDSAGEPVVIQATACRAGVGQRWIRPELDPRRPTP